MSITEEGFLPWRLSAERGRIRTVAAWPLKLAEDECVLELFSVSDSFFSHTANWEIIDQAVTQLRDVLLQVNRVRQDRLLARAFDSIGNAAYLMDINGMIVWCNEAFCRIYGHSREQLQGRNPRFLQSGQQGVRYYRKLWNTIRAGTTWTGEMVDRDNQGIAHTVRQTISPVIFDDLVTHYVAIHDNISRDKKQLARHQMRLAVDERTGLFTRATFAQRVNQSLKTANTRMSFLLLTMRKFHQALAGLGQVIEDQVVAAIGKRICGILELPHEAGVLGAGEYGILFHGGISDQELATYSERLRQQLSATYPTAGVPASVHTALAHAPDHGHSFHELYRHADQQIGDERLRPARRKTRGT